MKFLFSVLVLLLTGTSYVQAQKVSGKVLDENGKPLAYATVNVLKSKDSSLIKADVTNTEGLYDISFNKPGNIIIQYVMVGYGVKYTQVYEVLSNATVQIPDAVLKNKAKQLDEVVVVAKKPIIEVKADKMVFNVESSINATGSNALELLQKSPGVTVDKNDNISMKGKTGVRIYIDGKMSQLDAKDLSAYLRSINSSDIESIEMISNPSAKYDASGNAGIINIKLKKNKKYGTNGNLSGTFTQGITPKGNVSTSLNYRNKKVNVFSNVSGDMGIWQNPLNIYRVQRDSIYDQHGTNINNNQSLNVKAGVDYFLSNKHTIGVMATSSFSKQEFGGNSTNDIYTNTFISDSFVKRLTATNSIPGNRTNANFNFNYKYADTSGTEINFDADYGLFRGVGRSLQPNYYTDKNNSPLYQIINSNYTPTDIDIHTAKLDVERKIKKGKLGFGGKYSNVVTKNTFDFFNNNSGVPVKILSRSNYFKYTENVNALYANYFTQLSKKVSLQVGLRMENTESKGELTRADSVQQADNTVKRSYTDLFPSMALSWNINDKHSLNLTYSRRIDRPSYQDLNPFENKLDELTYQKGNAFLRPQYTHNVELTHTFMGFINTSVGYSHVSDFSTEATDTVGNATFVQNKNLATQQIINATLSTPLPIKKWWMAYFNFWYSYQMFTGKIGTNDVKVDIPLYGGYMQQTFTLSNTVSAEVSGWYNGPSIWGGTWRVKPQGGIDVGLQKQLLQKALTVKVQVTDVFKTMAPWRSTNEFGGLYLRANGGWESQTLRLSISYRFGSNQVKAARERSTGIESESGRIKK